MAATNVYPFTVREGSERLDDLKHVAKCVLGGAWKHFPGEDIAVTTIGGGITNLLFKLEGPKEERPVLVRIYGEDTDVLIDRERDNALFHELANMGYAPPFLGRFLNGRIEGFLPARPLEPHEMGQRSPVDFVSLIAREMAWLHALPVTTAGPAGEAEMWQVLPKWLQLARGLTFEDEAKASAIAALDLEGVCQEVKWVRKQLKPYPESGGSTQAPRAAPTNGDEPASGRAVDLNGGNAKVGVSRAGFGAETAGGVCQHVRGLSDGNESVDERAKRFLSKVVLCHNDLLSGNVLHADGWDRVQVIDFEYSGYNHRGFDIANHFCEHAGFDSNFAKSYPTPDTQVAYLKAYVQAATPVSATRNASAADVTPGIDSVSDVGVASEAAPCSDDEAFLEALRVQVNRWALPSHLWWAAWAVVQARYSPIDFDFVDYARLRLAGYRLHKEAFF